MMNETREKKSSLDIIYYFLISPQNGIELVREKNFFFAALFVATLSVLSSFTGDNLILLTAVLPENLSLNFMARLLLIYFLLFCTALLYNFIAEFFGRSEKATMLLALLGLSFLPGIFNTPLALVCSGINLEEAYGILKLLIIFWTIGLQVLCLHKLYNFSLTRSIMLYISPLLFILFLMFTFMLIFLTFFALNITKVLM